MAWNTTGPTPHPVYRVPSPPSRGKWGRPKKCCLDIVGDMRASSLTTMDMQERTNWRRNRQADPGLEGQGPGRQLGQSLGL